MEICWRSSSTWARTVGSERSGPHPASASVAAVTRIMRVRFRKRLFDLYKDSIVCQFAFITPNNELQVAGSQGCAIERQLDGSSRIHGGVGEFYFAGG